jgi:hypothetical protein
MQPTMVLRMAPDLFEPHLSVSINILSRIQMDILVHRAEGATYRKLCSDYPMCNQEALLRRFVRMELGFHWSRAYQDEPLSLFYPISTFTNLKKLPSNRTDTLIV